MRQRAHCGRSSPGGPEIHRHRQQQGRHRGCLGASLGTGHRAGDYRRVLRKDGKRARLARIRDFGSPCSLSPSGGLQQGFYGALYFRPKGRYAFHLYSALPEGRLMFYEGSWDTIDARIR